MSSIYSFICFVTGPTRFSLEGIIMKKLLGLVVSILALGALYANAAAESFALYFCSNNCVCSSVEELPADAGSVYYNSGDRYLFLPAGWDPDHLRVFFTGASEITLGNRILHSGDAAAVVPGEEITVTFSKKSGYTMQVIQSALIPAIFITTESGNIDLIKRNKTTKETGCCVFTDASGNNEYNGSLTYIRTRGNASLAYPKQPFQIKLDKSAGLAGMTPDRKWILLANYLDKSLIRNTIAFSVARYADIYSFVPEVQPVDMFLNHQYYGSFLLTEKCEIDENRLDIPDLEKKTEEINDEPLENYRPFGNRLFSVSARKGYRIPNNPEDISGGYLILANSRAYYAGEASGFVTRRGQAFTFDQPKYASEAQTVYAQDVFQNIEDALFSENGCHPETGKHWSELLDVETLAHRYLQAEVLADFDGQKPYFYKSTDADDPMVYCAPVWDQDNILGANDSFDQPSVFYICNASAPANMWFPQAMKIPEFSSYVIQLYQDVYAPALRILLGLENDPNGILLSLDQYAEEVDASARMDNIRWPIVANRPINLNLKTGTDQASNIEYLRFFIERRLAFLDKQWNNISPD